MIIRPIAKKRVAFTLSKVEIYIYIQELVCEYIIIAMFICLKICSRGLKLFEGYSISKYISNIYIYLFKRIYIRGLKVFEGYSISKYISNIYIYYTFISKYFSVFHHNYFL